MHVSLRPVAIGLLLGFLTILFGIGWAVYIRLSHEHIHDALRKGAEASVAGKFIVSQPNAPDESAYKHEHEKIEAVHQHDMHDHASMPVAEKKISHTHAELHDNPVMEEAHSRLTKGHVHAMGLGILSIVVSFLLGFLNIPLNMKTLASASIGVGALFYPFSWIIMGYRTIAIGIEGAEASVMPIVALSMFLILAGIITAFGYLVAGALRHR